jgi:hypothetical protein
MARIGVPTKSCYDVIKEQLLLSGYFTDSVPLHLITATLGGTIAVTACAPIDVIKSRVQSSTAQGVVSGLHDPYTACADLKERDVDHIKISAERGLQRAVQRMAAGLDEDDPDDNTDIHVPRAAQEAVLDVQDLPHIRMHCIRMTSQYSGPP